MKKATVTTFFRQGLDAVDDRYQIVVSVGKSAILSMHVRVSEVIKERNQICEDLSMRYDEVEAGPIPPGREKGAGA